MLFSRVGVNEPVLTGKEEEHVNNFNFNEYKKFMKDIKNEYPHLSISAQQQLAIERCAKLNEDRQSQDSHASSPPKFSMPNILGDVMAKLHFNLASEENGLWMTTAHQLMDLAPTTTMANGRYKPGQVAALLSQLQIKRCFRSLIVVIVITTMWMALPLLLIA